MARTTLSLARFVEAARETADRWWQTHAGRDLVESWPRGELRALMRRALAEWLAQISPLGHAGEYDWGSRWASGFAFEDFLLECPDYERLLGSEEEERFWQFEDLPTGVFFEAVELADQIDCFLASLEREGTLRQLPRDCRGDLDFLPVLADWCEDSGLPHAASEARHLHGLVRSYGFGS